MDIGAHCGESSDQVTADETPAAGDEVAHPLRTVRDRIVRGGGML